MAREIDWQLLEKAIDLTAAALQGNMGGGLPAPEFAAEVFKAVWEALKEAAEQLPEKPRAGIRPA